MEPYTSPRYVIEVDYFQQVKHKQQVCGDTFFSTRLRDENRTISILSDGLGSGVKASVLSTLTAVMAARFTAGYQDVKRTAEIIMKTLPVCKERKISYATFTIIDVDSSGMARIIEYDNPPAVIVRNAEVKTMTPTVIEGRIGTKRKYTLRYYQFPIAYGDRIVCFSDGVSQSGIGFSTFPLGWGVENATDVISETITGQPSISARELARKLVYKALANDGNRALDDITCGVVYYRKPRELLIVTGPPVDQRKDTELARMIEQHQGKTIVCGGTTAKLIARELKREIRFDLVNLQPGIPPASSMDGVDLVTEGILTLQRVADLLKEDARTSANPASPAQQIVDLMLNSDIIRFIVGTRINDAYQDPHIPQEIALRRSIIREIVHHLENKHLKQTHVHFI